MLFARAGRLASLAVVFVELAFSCSSSAAAQGLVSSSRSGDWTLAYGQGFAEYNTSRGSSRISIVCDEAASEDHSGTGINMEIGGKPPPQDSRVEFDIDGQRISMPFGDCEECARRFYELWPLLRKGRRLEVIASDGRHATFSLRGTSHLMPEEPCATRFPIGAVIDQGDATQGQPTPEADAAESETAPAAEAPAPAAPPAEPRNGSEAAAIRKVREVSDAPCLSGAASIQATQPSSRDRVQVTYSTADETVVVRQEPSALLFNARDGDDTIYVLDPPNGASVVGGVGSDVIVVCSMSGASLIVTMSDDSSLGDDLAPDELVIEPEVFLGVPDGFERQIRVFGFTQGSDVVRLRLPPGVDFAMESASSATTARAGAVAFTIHRADSPYGVTEAAFVVEHVSDVANPPMANADTPLASYDPSLTCADGDKLPNAKPSEIGDYAAYYDDAGELRIAALPGAQDHETGDDPDRIFSYTSQNIGAGAGADQVTVCALDEAYASVSVSQGLDFDADTVVVETARLQDGIARTLVVSNLTPRNDRVVLRVPRGLDVSFRNNTDGVPAFAQVGDLDIELQSADWRRGSPATADMFIVERSDENAPAAPGLARPGDVSGIACSDRDSGIAFTSGTADPTVPDAVSFSDGDDVALIRPGSDSAVTGDGDDLVYLFDPDDGFSLDTGTGSDTVLLCEIEAVSFIATLGGDALMSDVSPDTLILAPAVFYGVPPGLTRKIDVFGFLPQNDRLVLRLAPGVTVDEVRDTGTGDAEVRAGNVLVKLHRADDWQKIPFNGDSVVTESTAAITVAEQLPPRAVTDEELGAKCPEAGAAFDYTSPTVKVDSDIVFYTKGDETILIDGEPGILHYFTLGGDDVVYAVDPLANTDVQLGKGSDHLILCSMQELNLFVTVGPHDALPDTVIIEQAALGDVPGGYKREIRLYGIVDNNDRVVLRLPPGKDAKIERAPTADVLVATVGDNEISIFTTNEFEEPADSSVIVLQRAAGATAATPATATGTEASASATPASTSPAADSASWTTSGTASDGMLSASATASDGATTLSIDCNRRLGPSVGGALDGYPGDALARIDDQSDTLVFEFAGAKSFSGRVSYYAPDKAWALRDYPAEMLDTFASASRLTLRNGAGVAIAELSLKGSARARAAMKEVCGY